MRFLVRLLRPIPVDLLSVHLAYFPINLCIMVRKILIIGARLGFFEFTFLFLVQPSPGCKRVTCRYILAGGSRSNRHSIKLHPAQEFMQSCSAVFPQLLSLMVHLFYLFWNKFSCRTSSHRDVFDLGYSHFCSGFCRAICRGMATDSCFSFQKLQIKVG